MIYVYGDSHVNIFTGIDVHVRIQAWKEYSWDERTFMVCREGMHTAYKIKEKAEVLAEIREKIPQGSTLILSYGEIDCRRHLCKHNNVAETVDRYLEFVEGLKDYDLYLYLPPPTGIDKGCVGTEVERNVVTKEFNRLCKEKFPKTISIFDYLINDDMTTKKEYLLDGTHFTSEALPFLKEELKKHGENFKTTI